MAKILSTDDFYYGAVNGTLRRDKKHLQVSKTQKTNVFWYEPSLMTTCDAIVSNADIYELADNDIDTLPLNTGNWKYSADVKLIDKDSDTITNFSVSDLKVGNAFPNHSYIVPQVIFQRARYFGIAIPFPHLQHGEYAFKIRETWNYSDPNVNTTSIVRNVTIQPEGTRF